MPYLATQLSEVGFDVVTFNFSHNGIGPDGETFSDLDGFARNTLSLEKEEMMEMIHLCAFSDFLGSHLLHPLGVIGHSRGGGIALLASAASAEVKAVCTWAAVSTMERFPKAVMDAWRKKGYTEIKNSRTGETLRMGIDMLKDIESNARKRLNVLEAARSLRKPLLLLHGHDDETVPYYEAEQLNVFADPGLTELRLIPQGNHTFGATHPLGEVPDPLRLAMGYTRDFFISHLMPS